MPSLLPIFCASVDFHSHRLAVTLSPHLTPASWHVLPPSLDVLYRPSTHTAVPVRGTARRQRAARRRRVAHPYKGESKRATHSTAQRRGERRCGEPVAASATQHTKTKGKKTKNNKESKGQRTRCRRCSHASHPHLASLARPRWTVAAHRSLCLSSSQSAVGFGLDRPLVRLPPSTLHRLTVKRDVTHTHLSPLPLPWRMPSRPACRCYVTAP